MTDHVTKQSHPNLTEDQRAEVNEAVSKWMASVASRYPDTYALRMSDIYGHTVERIVAEVTA